jgi:hypothetical protein
MKKEGTHEGGIIGREGVTDFRILMKVEEDEKVKIGKV